MSKINIAANQFRTSFAFGDKNVLRWFPGHMNRGLKDMQIKLKSVDCLIEVHDARIAFSGRNPLFTQRLIGLKPHILILNKRDLIPTEKVKEIEKQIRDQGVKNLIFTNCKNTNCKGINQIIPTVTQLIDSSDRYNRTGEPDSSLLVIGVPNVGKSSLINALRNRHYIKGKAAQVGPVAGITRNVMNKIKISQNPLIYLYDTPGILNPSIGDIESGFRLALCSCLQDHLVGEIIIADYLLYILNKEENFKYVNVLGLDKPMDNITDVLADIALKRNLIIRIRESDGYHKKLNFKFAAEIFIKLYRTGGFGSIFLDQDKLLL